ncbi:hypothetical protein HFC70_02315 [Agrobacterium sp. a22-2]|uniref:hypothetical protein n=1 Tax=Agrobacterium sp. a22-2 TaxID=2283840 RepID=UPI001446F22B|nr:hypothetical protein [Agrobacterium sp. a22-2]NKN35184.1 hypothetical protein [Agrobacterium sp. a22-2]
MLDMIEAGWLTDRMNLAALLGSISPLAIRLARPWVLGSGGYVFVLTMHYDLVWMISTGLAGGAGLMACCGIGRRQRQSFETPQVSRFVSFLPPNRSAAQNQDLLSSSVRLIAVGGRL